MKQRFLAILLISVLILSVLIGHNVLTSDPLQEEMDEFFVGIDVAYDNLDEIKDLIDSICSYTNFFVIGCTGISYNETTLSETCQYLYDRDMYFLIYSDSHRSLQLFNDVRTKYENHFLGVYFYDEEGGKQLDRYDYRLVDEGKAENYTDASNQFVDGLNRWLTRKYPPNATSSQLSPTDFRLFSSDYSLYWFDYKAGYDVMLAQFGWNYSRQLNVALCRGAATAQNKEWGAIITWTYNDWPYLGTGKQLYDDLKLAYDNGAKYILVFDSDENYSQGILKDEHLDALKQFWEYAKNNPRISEKVNDRVAYVLPKDYGYGFRGPDDKIWGLWESSEFSYKLCTDLNHLFNQYGNKLDIIYEDGLETGSDHRYNKLIFWNETTYES